jgi:hypothetical protein
MTYDQDMRVVWLGFAFAAVVVGIYLFWIVSHPKPHALPAPGPDAVDVSFTTEPDGAFLTVDDVRVGRAPATLKLDPGPHRAFAVFDQRATAEQTFTAGRWEKNVVTFKR